MYTIKKHAGKRLPVSLEEIELRADSLDCCSSTEREPAMHAPTSACTGCARVAAKATVQSCFRKERRRARIRALRQPVACPYTRGRLD